jgi:hypothetical protein
MTPVQPQTTNQATPQTLSPQEQEELVIQALENRLRQLALNRNGALPRWVVW